jgi:hexosaminidase
MRLVRWCLFALLALFPAAVLAATPALIPLPASVVAGDGNFSISDRTIVEGKKGAEPAAAYLSQALGLTSSKDPGSRIRLQLVSDKVVRGPEAYRLRVMPREIRIEASDPRGLFYGAQTLRQLIAKAPDGSLTAPSVEINDSPRFRWRGLLIDVARHFFGKEQLLQIIDEMATYKLNVLKLHLTDYEGWRLEIPAYPRLTEVGAMVDGKPRYFTTAEMREIVQYAAARHIMVIPEIEMPGHAGAAARAYPEFFDAAGGAFNPANPKTYDFVRGVLSEVARIFPAPYLHFGGDEVAEETWKGMADVDRLKAEKGLTTTDDVEAYFGKKVVGIIESLGKKPMAWDEQVDAQAPKSVVIQWWRKGRPEVLTAAANAGYELVMSPADKAYFDYNQGLGEPGAPWEGNDGGPISVAKILAWEPVPDSFTPEEESRVLGVEAAVWTEFIETDRYLQFMTFPRLLAFAELGWRPKGVRDEKEFSVRLEPHIEALRAKGINARRGEWDAYEFIRN